MIHLQLLTKTYTRIFESFQKYTLTVLQNKTKFLLLAINDNFYISVLMNSLNEILHFINTFLLKMS